MCRSFQKCAKPLGGGPERAEDSAQDDDGDQREDRADDTDSDDVAVAFAVGRPANGKQGNDRAIVGKAVQRAGADDRDAVQQRRVETYLLRAQE